MKKKLEAFLGFIFILIIFILVIKSFNEVTANNITNKEVKLEAKQEEVLLNKGVSNNVEIEIISYKNDKQVGDNEFLTKKANGIYKIIKIKITNNKNDKILISNDSFKIIDDKNREFSTSNDSIYLKDSLFYDLLNPGLTISGLLLFDVPENLTGMYLKTKIGLLGEYIKLKI